MNPFRGFDVSYDHQRFLQCRGWRPNISVGTKDQAANMTQETHREADTAEREMRFQLKDLKKEFQDKLGSEIGKYSIPLILDWDFIGSGTLIRLGECFGILTASHVVSNNDWEVDCGAYSKQVLRVAVADYAHDLSIEARRLQIER